MDKHTIEYPNVSRVCINQRYYTGKISKVVYNTNKMRLSEYIENNLNKDIIHKGVLCIVLVDGDESMIIPNQLEAENESLYKPIKTDEIIEVVEDAIISHNLNFESAIEYKPLIECESIEEEITAFPSNIYKTYLMKDGNGYTKIGRSKNPELRERTLQSENPTIELLATVNDDIESFLQNKYSAYNVRGEWFKLSDKQINSIIKRYKFVIKTLENRKK